VGPPVAVVGVLATTTALAGLTYTVANIHQWSLRQTVTPDHLQGRVTAAHRFLVFGSGAIGAVLGGALGSGLGLRRALLLCVIANLVVRLPTIASPLRTLRRQPAAPAPIS
jgi:Na+/melibiose symporter-like transporter